MSHVYDACARNTVELQILSGTAKLILLLPKQPTFAEFHLLYLLHALTHLTPTLLSSYPTLRAWNDQMWAREGLRKYRESRRMKEMLNGNANGQREVRCGA